LGVIEKQDIGVLAANGSHDLKRLVRGFSIRDDDFIAILGVILGLNFTDGPMDEAFFIPDRNTHGNERKRIQDNSPDRIYGIFLFSLE
jgi:hypothetical protein